MPSFDIRKTMTRYFAKIILALFAGFLFIPSLSAVKIEWDRVDVRKEAEAKVGVTVVDVDGKPLAGVPVIGRFYHDWKMKVNKMTAPTDENGHVWLSGMCDHNDILITVEKEGWYTTSYDLAFSGDDYPGDDKIGVKNGKWFPYAVQRTYVFKEKRNPIPMVAFDTCFPIPDTKKEYGYDLEYGSLVEPYGDGKVADFYLKGTWWETDRHVHTTMTIRFPNEKDGAYVFPVYTCSELWSPHEADPEAEYVREFTFSCKYEKDPDGPLMRPVEKKMIPESDGLIFRTRSVVDATGTLVSAHYGKIYGGLEVDGRKPDDVSLYGVSRLLLFFNPVENDTNLEWDGKAHEELKKGKHKLFEGKIHVY